MQLSTSKMSFNLGNCQPLSTPWHAVSTSKKSFNLGNCEPLSTRWRAVSTSKMSFNLGNCEPQYNNVKLWNLTQFLNSEGNYTTNQAF